MDFGNQILDFEGVRIQGESPFLVFENDFDALREEIKSASIRFPHGGAIGYFAYEAARAFEPRAFIKSQTDDFPIPAFRLVFYRNIRRETSPQPTIAAPRLIEVPDDSRRREFYCGGVETIQNLIAAGDIYQANLTHRFELETAKSPMRIYDELRALGAAPRGALLSWNDFSIVSNSPETFLTLRNGVLEAKPIKGTIRRGSNPTEDENFKTELRLSEKNRAENVMIVDLMRNDLGRVCEFGSVQVPKLYEIETFPTLHHGVSTVRGQLRDQFDALDAFCAAFPCGSITGAPKIRAMQILSELEPVSRGVSMGAIGYFGFDGSMEWNVAIRTATLFDHRAIFHVGGGIVADSQPQSEYDEMRLKARALWSVCS